MTLQSPQETTELDIEKNIWQALDIALSGTVQIQKYPKEQADLTFAGKNALNYAQKFVSAAGQCGFSTTPNFPASFIPNTTMAIADGITIKNIPREKKVIVSVNLTPPRSAIGDDANDAEISISAGLRQQAAQRQR